MIPFFSSQNFIESKKVSGSLFSNIVLQLLPLSVLFSKYAGDPAFRKRAVFSFKVTIDRKSGFTVSNRSESMKKCFPLSRVYPNIPRVPANHIEESFNTETARIFTLYLRSKKEKK